MTSSHHCPNCGKELGPGDFSEDAPHRIARRVKDLVFPVTVAWTIALFILFCMWLALRPGMMVSLGTGWLIMICLPVVPGFVLALLWRLFPRVRVWRCSRCGHVHESPLEARGVDPPQDSGQAPLPSLPPWLSPDAPAPRIEPRKPKAPPPPGKGPPPLPPAKFWNAAKSVGTACHCPNCGKELGAGDHSEDAPHRTARRLKSLVFPVTFGWVLFLIAVFVFWLLLYHPAGRLGSDRGIGWLIICLPAIPGFVLTMLAWLFPKVRIWTCSRCGHVHEVPLQARRILAPEGSGEMPTPPWLADSKPAPQIKKRKWKAPPKLEPIPKPETLRAMPTEPQTDAAPPGAAFHCPCCGKELGAGDFNEVVPHPIARRIKAAIFPVMVVWSALVVAGLLVGSYFYTPSTCRSGLDWLAVFICLLPAPWIFLVFLSWFFPKMRRWQCRQCGYLYEVRLTAHPHPEPDETKAAPSPNAERRDPEKSHRKPGYDRKPRGKAEK